MSLLCSLSLSLFQQCLSLPLLLSVFRSVSVCLCMSICICEYAHFSAYSVYVCVSFSLPHCVCVRVLLLLLLLSSPWGWMNKTRPREREDKKKRLQRWNIDSPYWYTHIHRCAYQSAFTNSSQCLKSNHACAKTERERKSDIRRTWLEKIMSLREVRGHM